MKKSSSRSQRGSKGIKGKHIFQICVLLGVCIWLIYQVKYSHDKKKEFFEKDVKKSESEDGLVKLGRKDLLPGYHNQNEKEKHVEEDEDEEEISHGGEEKESKSKVENGVHEEEEKEDEEEVVEEDEEDKNKQGEEVVEEDEEENKHEEDIDEQEQSKTVGDSEKDDEFIEEEKESESIESDAKDKETNHVDEIDMTVDEARDEHYKADDASSAVSHESRILNTNETVQEKDSNVTASEVEIQKEPVWKLGEAESGDFVDKPTTELKDSDSQSSSKETKSTVTESKGDSVNGNSTSALLEASRFLQNETEIMRDRSQKEDAQPAGISDLKTVLELEQTLNESDPNIIVSANTTNRDSIQDDSRNSTSESSILENISGSNTTENSRSEGDDESGEKESSQTLPEEAEDTSENSVSQEEMEALTDPQTLPDIRIEGNEEDEEEAIAAE